MKKPAKKTRPDGKYLRQEAAARQLGLVTDAMLMPRKKKVRRSLMLGGVMAALMLACAPVAPVAIPQPEPKPCCRYCTSSKACGDGCIPYENACHKAPGCACTVGVRAP